MLDSTVDDVPHNHWLMHASSEQGFDDEVISGIRYVAFGAKLNPLGSQHQNNEILRYNIKHKLT